MSMTPAKVTMVALIGGCALLGGLIALVHSGVGQGVDSLPPEAQRVPQVPEASSPADPLQEGDYLVVIERPLFNQDRRPVPEELVVTCEEGDARPECQDETQVTPEAQPLNVTVRGIVITPQVKLVTLTDNDTNETMRIREGMPLDGEYGSWTIASIEPRSVTFADQDGESVPLELEVHTKAMAGGKPPPPRAPVNLSRQPQEAQPAAASSSLVQVADQDNQKPDEEDDAEAAARAARAEEIRRRVAERRAQLRQEAARRRESQEEGRR